MLKIVARASFYVLSSLMGFALLISVSSQQVAAAACDSPAQADTGTASEISQCISQTSEHDADIPAPAAAWLLGSALLGLLGVSRHKRASDD